MAGPSLPDPPAKSSAPVVGPSLPPPLAGSAAPAEDGDSSDDEFMPALPPEIQAARKAKALAVLGPSLPPGFRRARSDSPGAPATLPAAAEDDEAGPMPFAGPAGSNAGENEGIRAIREREEREAERERLEKESKASKRPEWMLVPPKELDMLGKVDPTKLKSRGFRQTNKPHAGSSTDRTAGPGNLWTETPAERAQRLEDEVMGKRRRAEDAAREGGDAESAEARKRRKRDEEMRSKVEAYNESSRGATLLDLHSRASASVERAKTAADREKEKKEEVIWDREKMLGSGGKLMGERQKRDLIKDAKGLGGRFGGGSYL